MPWPQQLEGGSHYRFSADFVDDPFSFQSPCYICDRIWIRAGVSCSAVAMGSVGD